ncbi:hypothetical protein LUZ60_011516 [Juncus effusus]|nr:hypothetical protein LUZ60_011516 [Juncus effusus]
MGTKVRQTTGTDSPKAEVGEIDTRAPFESVKAAVSLFGEVAFSSDRSSSSIRKPKTAPQTERVLAKETELHLAQKELNKYKEQLDNAETTRVQALAELDKAKTAVEELTLRLNEINKSKELALKATEEAKSQTAQLEMSSAGTDSSLQQEMEAAREQYVAALADLDLAKQELRNLKKDFESSLEAKLSAVKQESDARELSETNAQRAAELAQEIASAQESLGHVKSATEQAKQEESKILSEKNSARQTYKQKTEETINRIEDLKKDFDPSTCEGLEGKLAEATAEILSVQNKIESARAADLESITTINRELEEAKEMLSKVGEEEKSLKQVVELLKEELEKVRKEHEEMKEKDAETEAVIGELQLKLQKCKDELAAADEAERKVSESSDELAVALQQLSSESNTALQEAEVMKKSAEDLTKEAEAAQTALKDAEKRLEQALKDAEEAKAAESTALNQIKELSERTHLARASTSSESANKITISKEEFETLSRKVEESEKLSDMKVAAAMAQIEAVKASENEAINKLEAARKEMEEMEAATEEAVKKAEMAEAAKKAVEGELKRWRDKEQKKTAEAAARILADSQEEQERVNNTDVVLQPKARPPVDQKSKSKMGNKKSLLPTLSAIFHKKKGQSEGGSPSNPPGERPT